MDADETGANAGRDRSDGPAGHAPPEAREAPADRIGPPGGPPGAEEASGAAEAQEAQEAQETPDAPETPDTPEAPDQPSVDPAPPPAGPRAGVDALSPRYQVGAALALAVVAVVVCVHVGLMFLHVAPANTLTKQHGAVVDEWIYPEFEQNWKLFAPNPLQQNISVQVRAEVSTADGGVRTTGWYDLSAQDGRAIRGNPLPSHTQQNELRRAWDFFLATHDSDNRPVGLRGALSESYLLRIAALRLERDGVAGPGGSVDRVQYRSRTTAVAPPSWSGEKVSAQRPDHRELPWWPMPARDTEGGAA